jgi:hypothetical protein
MIELPKSAYAPQTGSLAFIPKQKNASPEWFTCREQFHTSVVQRKDQNFLFAFSEGERQKIIDFMEEVQNKIGLPISSRIKFVDTSMDNVLYIEIGSWWGNQNIRISFLTALLRCGRVYNGDFQGALFSQLYTYDTKPAVDRFLSGCTHYLGKGSQWHATFSDYRTKLDYAERMLIREEESKVTDDAMQEAKHIIETANENTEVLIHMLARSLDEFYRNGFKANGGEISVLKARVFGEDIA